MSMLLEEWSSCFIVPGSLCVTNRRETILFSYVSYEKVKKSSCSQGSDMACGPAASLSRGQ